MNTYARIEPAPREPLPPITAGAVAKRAAIWTAVCGIAAVPSFVVAWDDADRGAMALGVMLFIGAYVAISCMPLMRRVYRKPFMKLSILIGYSVRLVATAVFPYAWIGDFLPGILAVGLTEQLFKVQYNAFNTGTPQSFAATLFTTIVQGVLLNLIVGLLIVVIYFVQRLFRKHPHAIEPRGFDVLPTAEAPGTVDS
jgi:hypothetical protein